MEWWYDQYNALGSTQYILRGQVSTVVKSHLGSLLTTNAICQHYLAVYFRLAFKYMPQITIISILNLPILFLF